MKKLLMLLMLAVSLFACEGPTGPMGPMGPPGYDGEDGRNGYDGKDGKDGKDGQGAHWFAKSFTIQPDDWILIGQPGELKSYFVAEKELPQLTKEIFRERAVIAYIETGHGMKNGMPYVLHKGENGSNGKEFIWTETYDFDYSEGLVGFYLTYSDFNTQVKPNEPIIFHIVLIW